MAQTMRKVKGKHEKVRESGHKARLRDVECGSPAPTQARLDDGAERLAAWLRGETRVMLDEVQELPVVRESEVSHG